MTSAETPIVAFQGEHGANSEEAIKRYFGSDAQSLPCHSFRDIFIAMQEQRATHGMLPVENMLAGTVAYSYELLMEYDFRVQGEYILPIRYYLLAPQGSTLEDIKYVKSHPQALAQCEHYIRRRGFEPVASYDTAGAARELAQNPEPHTAAIANEFAGKLYQLTALERSLEDDPDNSTRFFVLGRDDAPAASNSKTSLVFAVRDRPGALYNCLGAFAAQNINMTKLESRPMRGRPWQYWFYVDIEGHWQEPRIELALVELLRQAAFVKMLGSYPRANGSAKNGDSKNGGSSNGGSKA